MAASERANDCIVSADGGFFAIWERRLARSSLSRTAVHASGFLSHATPSHRRPSNPRYHPFFLASTINCSLVLSLSPFSPSFLSLSSTLSLLSTSLFVYLSTLLPYFRIYYNRRSSRSLPLLTSLSSPSSPSWKGAHTRTWRRRCQGDCATSGYIGNLLYLPPSLDTPSRPGCS